MSLSSIFAVLVPAAVLGWCLVTYNQLVALRNQFQNAFAQIEEQNTPTNNSVAKQEVSEKDKKAPAKDVKKIAKWINSLE